MLFSFIDKSQHLVSKGGPVSPQPDLEPLLGDLLLIGNLYDFLWVCVHVSETDLSDREGQTEHPRKSKSPTLPAATREIHEHENP